jgi:type 1 glutamine amidotransferase
VRDEAYKNKWISPAVQVLLETDHPENDRAVAWVSPYAKSKVVYIQLGHASSTHREPAYRQLVRNAMLWTAGRLV